VFGFLCTLTPLYSLCTDHIENTASIVNKICLLLVA
jgi:hypothetical protein